MVRTNLRRNMVLTVIAGFTVVRLASAILAPTPAHSTPVTTPEPAQTVLPQEILEAESLPELPAVDTTADSGEKVSDTDPLIKAIMSQNADELRKAIMNGTNINRQTVDRSYPVIVAAVHGTAEQMKILTANSVNVHVVDDAGRNGMHYSAILGDVEKAKLMSAMRVDVNAFDKEGMTPLYYAYLNGNIPVAEFLVKEGKADINQLDDNGNMLALHVLKAEDNQEQVKHMLASGLSLFRKDVHGRTLVDLVRKMGNEELAKQLQQSYDQQLKEFIDAQKKPQSDKQEPKKK